MSNEDLIWLLFFLSVGALLYLMQHYRGKNKLSDDTIDGIDGLADTDLVCVPFKGEWVTLTKIDYLNRWMNMNRHQRAKVWDAQMKAIKQGKAKKHFFGEDKRYQIVPTEKGKEFSNIHKLKEEIYLERN
jgi:hypothetical protein